MTNLIDSLPDLSREYPISEDQIAQYRRDGHIFLPGVCTPEEIAAHRKVFQDVVHKYHPAPPPLEERDIFHQAFLSATNTFVRYPETRPFLFARRFAKIAAELTGVGGVRIYPN